MPSPEEFGNAGGEAHSVGAPPNIETLKERARAIRRAQRENAPIPGTGVSMVQPQAVAPFRPAPPQAQPAQFVTGMTASPASDDDELDLIRTRFKLANYYEALIEQPIFGDDVLHDPFAAQVHAEVTAWVKNRMAELVGIRNNPEGFTDEEVQLLKGFVQAVGLNGVRALIALADRVLNPPVQLEPPPRPTTPSAPMPAPTVEPPFVEEDEPSALDLTSGRPPLPLPPEQPPQVQATKPHAPRVRRARAPGAPPTATVTTAAEPDDVTAPPKTRGRKRQADPLAAGRALVASAAGPATPSAPAVTQAAPTPEVQPVPMPKGMGMTMAMEQKAGEALRSAKVIEATGGGVL